MTTEFTPEHRPVEHAKECSIHLGDSGVCVVVESADVNPAGTRYVRFVDADGIELACWAADEWHRNPEEVMGAIFGIIADHTWTGNNARKLQT